MKKILVILIILLAMIPCFARTYTEEEFREVYNALVESTELLEESKATISDLQSQIDNLTESNNKLIGQLESAKSELKEANSLLEKAEKELKNSSKIIEKLNNQRILIGGGLMLSTDFQQKIIYGAKINAGYKLWLGYFAGEFQLFNDRTFSFGVSYNVVL